MRNTAHLVVKFCVGRLQLLGYEQMVGRSPEQIRGQHRVGEVDLVEAMRIGRGPHDHIERFAGIVQRQRDEGSHVPQILIGLVGRRYAEVS